MKGSEDQMELFATVFFYVLHLVLVLVVLNSPIGKDITWWHAAICGVLSTVLFFRLWKRNYDGFDEFMAAVFNSVAMASWLVLCWRLFESATLILKLPIAFIGVILLFGGPWIYPLVGTKEAHGV